MPIYEYECTNKKCKHIEEELLPISKQPKTMKCPKCGKRNKKIFSTTTNHIFKGDGWADKKR